MNDDYSVAEIAANLGISIRAVERKLQIIRGKCSAELAKVK